MTMTSVSRRVKGLVAAGAVVGAIAGVGLVAAPAQATQLNGSCESGELCQYYLTGYRGAIFDLASSDLDFSNNVFPTSGYSANNNTESYWNRDTYTWYVYTGANRTGYRGTIAPGASSNYNSTYKNTVSGASWHL
jgi:hypothetical protein